MKRKRNSNASRIASQPNALAMMDRALYGRVLSPIELAAQMYLQFRMPTLPQFKVHDTGSNGGDAESLSNEWAEKLAACVVEAVANSDIRALRTLQRTVANPKLPEGRADKARFYVALFKDLQEKSGSRMTFAELKSRLAELRLDDRTLHRICKQLKFPLAPGRTGRPKKSVK